jgi:hypothetical protein
MRPVQRSAISVCAIAVALSMPAFCQPKSTAMQSAHTHVTIVHVKPDMVNEWFDLEKTELMPAQKKGGIKTRTTYATVFGNSFEYVIVTPFEKYAEMDDENPVVKALGRENATRLRAKIRRCVESQQSFVSSPVTELTNLPEGELAPMGVFTRVRVASGRMQEYQNFVKAEILPLYKKMNARYSVSRRGLGANTNDLTSITWVYKAADLDAGSPVTRALGADGAAKLMAKTAGMTTLIEQVVRREVPELSY